MSVPPKEDASRLELRARPRPVTRLNRKALIVLVGALAAIILLATLWAMRKPATRDTDRSEELHNVERVTKAEGLSALPQDYASLPKAPQLGPPGGEFGRPMVRAEREAGLEELPERSGFQRNPEEDALRAQRLKEQSEAQETAKAQVFFQLKDRGGGRSSPQPTSESLRPVSQLDGEDALAVSTAPERDSQEQKRAFIAGKPDSRIYASADLQTPRSPYQLTSGITIPAALVTGINSDLPGVVIARVTKQVYDSVTGQHLLIPQGATLLGEYDSQVTYGQRRVLLVWTRLTFPDGASIVLDRIPAVDTAGFTGLEDRVDWHWRRIFAGAAVSTLLGAGTELATPDRSGRDGAVVIATRESVQDTVNQVGQEITRRNLDIQPTLTVRPGFPVRVIINRDLVLKPYEG